jgi:hypothetical protein
MTRGAPEGPLKRLHAAPDERRVAALWRRIERSRARGLSTAEPSPWKDRRAQGFALAAAVAAAFVAAVSLNESPEGDAARGELPSLTLASGAPLPARLAAEERRSVRLSDGSVLRLAAGAELALVANEAGLMELAQRRGRVTYDVARAGRRWVIDAGAAAVEVLGTRFEVERDEREVDVEVRSGAVLVRSALLRDGVQRLEAGERVHLAPPAEEPASAGTQRSEARAQRSEARAQRSEARAQRSEARAQPEERSRAQEASLAGDGSASRDPGAGVSNKDRSVPVPSERLLRRADAARRKGDMDTAERLLAVVVARHDERSAVAAFTLGKLRERPAKAAADFRTALRLGLDEPLRQLARERIEELTGAARHVEDPRRDLAAPADAGRP